MALNNELNESLNSKWATAAIMSFYHFATLFMPAHFNILAIMTVFVSEISFKIFKLCQFVSQKERLADLYKKDPEKTQKEYDAHLAKKVEVTMAANDHQLKTAKETMKQSIKD